MRLTASLPSVETLRVLEMPSVEIFRGLTSCPSVEIFRDRVVSVHSAEFFRLLGERGVVDTGDIVRGTS